MNLTTKIAELVADKLGEALGNKPEERTLETTLQSILNEVGREALEISMNRLVEKYPPTTITCCCGQKASYLAKRHGCCHMLYGRVHLKRAYYLCAHCHIGSYPLDQKLGFRPNQLSVTVENLVATLGVQLPFGTSAEMFKALTQVSISDQAIRKATQSKGEQVQQWEEEQQQKAQPEPTMRSLPYGSKVPLRLYGTMDATKVLIRDAGGDHWRDLKIGAFFEAIAQPPRAPDGKWAIQAQKQRYFADIAPAQLFGDLVWTYGVQQRAHLARELIFIADGAEWIWNLVAQHFPKAIQILDWFHASEHLMPVAIAAFACETKRLVWYTATRQLLWKGKIKEVVASINELASHCSANILRTTANYYESHAERMRYDYFRKQGYQIGSGTIESAAKQVGLMRMKVSGARWNLESARLVAKARAAYLSDHWASLPVVC